MKATSNLSLPLCLAARESTLSGPPTVHTLMSLPLADIPGEEAVLLSVEFGPGGADPIHRHNAHGLVHVVEGSVVIQVRSKDSNVLTNGKAFDGGPSELLIVDRNAISTKSARILAFLVKDLGAPALLPEDYFAAPFEAIIASASSQEARPRLISAFSRFTSRVHQEF